MTSRAVTGLPVTRILSRGVIATGALAILLVALVAADPQGAVFLVSYTGTGLVLIARRPRQAIGWLLVLIGVGLLMGAVRVLGPIDHHLAGISTATEAATVWANGTGWAAGFIGFVGLALVFPSGRLPGGRARLPSKVIAVLSVGAASLIAFGPVMNVTMSGDAFGTDVPNPLAITRGSLVGIGVPTPDALYTMQFVLFACALVGLLLRYRTSSGIERLQYRWLAWAVALVAVANGVWAIVTLVLRSDLAAAAWGLVLVAYPTVPLAVGVAVLRYRLYDIDRVVSRTLGWGIATTAVIGVFVGAVLALQTLLAGVTQGGTLAAAASTLLAFALFQPVRGRIQALVDGRFDRPRLEAERILAAHGERLQHETDLLAIESGVLDTVSATLRPATTSVWVRRRVGSSAP
ncbi:MAG: hypothetical protein ABIR11_12330 [Candidatus Limnocylindrales bacterium]